jgi:hypothetical protein
VTALALGVLSLVTLLAMASRAEAGTVSFAAIALDRVSGTVGAANGYETRDTAQRAALRDCRVRSDTNWCRNVVYVRNGCAAVAVLPVRTPPGTPYRAVLPAIAPMEATIARTEWRAKRKALRRCGRPRCYIRASICTSG